MKIELTPVKKGEYVEVFADVASVEDELLTFVATPLKFEAVHLLHGQKGGYSRCGTPVVSIPIKEARTFARRVLALTRQDGDTESELEAENRKLKEKLQSELKKYEIDVPWLEKKMKGVD
jgi:hypothetical protein